MKTQTRTSTLLGALLLAACGATVQAQQYSVPWFKISSGGGHVTNGGYSLNATIGQHDASVPVTGGNYSLTGGYWPLPAAPVAPRLRIFLWGSNAVVVAWPASSTGWTLLVSTNLARTNWVPAGGAVNVVGGENQVVISPPTGTRFYRLSHP